jgi:transcription antitermination protein NusB
MGARRSGREAALQMLFQLEASSVMPDQAVELFWRTFEADPEGRSYADAVLRGVAENLAPIDERITSASKNWRLERMSRVDRNILRLATCELAHFPQTPVKVAINEAVELAKRFGAAESAAFVNGILDRIAAAVGRSADEG